MASRKTHRSWQDFPLGKNLGKFARGKKDIFPENHRFYVTPPMNSLILDMLNVIFLLFSKVNHHQTTIRDNFLKLFPSILSKSKLWAIHLKPLDLNSWFGLLAENRYAASRGGNRYCTWAQHVARLTHTPNGQVVFFGGLSHRGCWTKTSYPFVKSTDLIRRNEIFQVAIWQSRSQRDRIFRRELPSATCRAFVSMISIPVLLNPYYY